MANSTTLPAIDPFLRDGFEVHAAALARGFDVTLLPRQVLLVGSGDSAVGEGSFVHGVPQASTVAGVTFAQDKRVRRAMLQRAGFSVPKGATFSIGRSRGAARRYAERIGYPVVMKPAMGDNTIGVVSPIEDSEALDRTIEYMHTPVETREDFTRASYAMTELRDPGMQNGEVVAPPGYRFLIENYVRGDYVRLLVLDGEVRNALHCQQGPWRTPGEDIADVTSLIDPSLADVAVRASRVIPGLALVALDVVVPEMQMPVLTEDVQIVELSERPWLASQHAHHPELARSLALKILGSEVSVPGHAPEPEIEVDIGIGGVVDARKLLDALLYECRAIGVSADLSLADPALGTVRGSLRGVPSVIAWLLETMLDSGIHGERAMQAELRVTDRAGSRFAQPSPAQPSPGLRVHR